MTDSDDLIVERYLRRIKQQTADHTNDIISFVNRRKKDIQEFIELLDVNKIDYICVGGVQSTEDLVRIKEFIGENNKFLD